MGSYNTSYRENEGGSAQMGEAGRGKKGREVLENTGCLATCEETNQMELLEASETNGTWTIQKGEA